MTILRTSPKVFRKIKSSLASKKGFSQSFFQFLSLEAAGNSAKFIEPIFNEHISGLNLKGASSLCSTVISRPPPVVILTTASVDSFITGKNLLKIFGSEVGLPFFGSLACKCNIEAPALAASIDCFEISSGVSGR